MSAVVRNGVQVSGERESLERRAGKGHSGEDVPDGKTAEKLTHLKAENIALQKSLQGVHDGDSTCLQHPLPLSLFLPPFGSLLCIFSFLLIIVFHFFVALQEKLRRKQSDKSDGNTDQEK